ncbi:DEAD/DEAH box helicase [Bacillus subtilis]|uniref:DEAD/DEAH box helicase n=1 Tax=Bacillus subtilis TaxID=1423 RepID=UPI001B94E400|nr:DEAD/DEAH box helicase [Bacillus subtilis]CAF1831240.1 ATP-dependent RecD-like DNA helicase [Bacillus subtilis]CAF1905717.1 ATP-dependent RecD-like DNA helicase [Bacillus subtilis]CAF1916538.1 ATP-dependent RecD-like DNA helicase [Bacillus subtilis]
MGKINVNSVLRAWHLVEALSPSGVNGIGDELSRSHFLDGQQRKKTEQVLFSERPWERHQLKDSEKNFIQFRYYLGCFEQHKLVSYLRDLFQNNEEMINRDQKMLFSMSFLVDHTGKYVKDSAFVPVLMYVMKLINEHLEVPYDDLMTTFRDQLRLFEEQVDAIFVNGVTEKALKKVLGVYERYFLRIDNMALHYFEKEILKVGQDGRVNNFHSFFLEDLGDIISQGENETLRQFIEGVDNRKNIDENRVLIEDVLQPKNVPNGRWPSPVEHRLSLMQQVAVNQIINNNQKISSVNGPPGTGKTTLLKDIFANLMVEKAEKMACFENPEKALKKIKKLVLDGYHYTIYEIDKSINQYSMVVASSNNGAVENISKDLPKKKEVIRKVTDENVFSSYEKAYALEAEELSMFPFAAKALLGEETDAWGLFSASLGKSENISHYYKKLYYRNNNEFELSFIEQLERENKKISLTDWKNALTDFQQTLKSVKQKKAELQSLCEIFKKYKDINNQLLLLEAEQEKLVLKTAHYKQQKRLLEREFHTLSKPTFFQRIFHTKRNKLLQMEDQLQKITMKIKNEEKEWDLLQMRSNQIRMELKKYRDSINNKCKNQGLVIPDDNYWTNSQSAYEYRQLHTPWLTDGLNFERGLLFLKGMKVHKLFLIFNYKAIKSSLRLLNYRSKLDLNQTEHRMWLQHMWGVIHLITPVISTTFASVRTMYKGVGRDFIRYLFIDEAGQATPQQAAGALWRSQKVVVVGDPIQIEPVVTIDRTILGDIKKFYGIEDRFIEIGSSVQSLADAANPFGMYNNKGQWIGIPLWVHRRCLNPMFTIANQIAYDNKMVLAIKKQGKSEWFDCKGVAVNKQFVKEQADLVAEEIYQKWENTLNAPDLYVITPFTAVKDGLRKTIKKRLAELNVPKKIVNDWTRSSIGTTHTFQGKEADTVYFVVGTDQNSDGAANWSCSKPNLINVAVTRAKKEFYIVGDYDRLSKKQNYKSIAENVDQVIRPNTNRSTFHV